MQWDWKKMMKTLTQAMACMCNTQKNPNQKSTGTKPTGGKPYLGNSRPSEVAKGLDGTTNTSLTCHYCKGAGHKLDNCGKLQLKIKREQLAAKSIIAEQVFKKKHPWKGVQ